MENDGRMKHGLYSQNAPEALREKIEHARESGDVENLEDEIHLMRAALDRLSEDFGTMPPEELERLVKMSSKVARNVERLHKIRYGEKNTITVQQVDQFVEVVRSTIRDEFDRCNSARELINAIGVKLQDVTAGALSS